MAEKRESNTGLIITLVFFILATLGLGVSTYYGFAEQDKLKEETTKANKDKSKSLSMAEFNKAQAALYWAYISSTDPVGNPADLKTTIDHIDGQGGQPEPQWVKEYKNDPEFLKTKKRMGDLEKAEPSKLKVDKGRGGPISNFSNLLAEMRAENSRMSGELAKANSDKKAAEDAKTKTESDTNNQLAINKKAYESDVAKVQKDYQAYKTKLDEKSTLIDPDVLLKILTESKNKELEDQFAVKEKYYQDQDKESRKNIAKLQKENSELQKKFGDHSLEGKPNGNVVEISGSGSSVFINLGSVVDVRPGDIFSIFGLQPDGQPNQKPKGRLEVVSIIGDQMAKARIVDIRDRTTDPVLRGDFLFNPVWAPNFRTKIENRKRIVVIGLPVIFSRSKDPLKDFMRIMEERNITVDAYIDPTKVKILPNGKEGVSVRTDYLIIAEDPLLKDKEKEYLLLKKELESECDRYRVEKMRLDRFLDLIGVVGN